MAVGQPFRLGHRRDRGRPGSEIERRLEGFGDGARAVYGVGRRGFGLEIQDLLPSQRFGFDWPFSHRFTVANETPMRSPSCIWVSSRRRRTDLTRVGKSPGISPPACRIDVLLASFDKPLAEIVVPPVE